MEPLRHNVFEVEQAVDENVIEAKSRTIHSEIGKPCKWGPSCKCICEHDHIYDANSPEPNNYRVLLSHPSCKKHSRGI